AVVELDALADAVRATAQDHDLVAVARRGLAFVLVGRIQVGGAGGEFAGAGVYALVDRAHLVGTAQRTDRRFVGAGQLGQTRIGEPGALERAQAPGVERVDTAGLHQLL